MEGKASCGAKGDRTPDLVNAIHALSQLSYSPEFQKNMKSDLKQVLISADPVERTMIEVTFDPGATGATLSQSVTSLT